MTIRLCTCSAQLQPHDRMPGVCPAVQKWHRGDCPEIWGYGCNCGGIEPPCDDCGRADGTHNLEVEH